jgi:hypothetical protein
MKKLFYSYLRLYSKYECARNRLKKAAKLELKISVKKKERAEEAKERAIEIKRKQSEKKKQTKKRIYTERTTKAKLKATKKNQKL